MTTTSVKLRDTRDHLGTRYLGAKLSADGTLTIQGHDLGEGVERSFGYWEYEWAWTIQPEDVATLKSALDSGDDVLAALAARFSNNAAVGLQPFFDENGVRYEFWSRVGD